MSRLFIFHFSYCIDLHYCSHFRRFNLAEFFIFISICYKYIPSHDMWVIQMIVTSEMISIRQILYMHLNFQTNVIILSANIISSSEEY